MDREVVYVGRVSRLKKPVGKRPSDDSQIIASIGASSALNRDTRVQIATSQQESVQKSLRKTFTHPHKTNAMVVTPCLEVDNS